MKIIDAAQKLSVQVHPNDETAPLVGGDAVELEPGEYVLEVRSDPPLEVEGIVLAGGQSLTYELEVPQSLTTDEEDAP